ncbi:MAG: hypothetical protein AAF412_11755, partial [Pseudomonadota bacterium]
MIVIGTKWAVAILVALLVHAGAAHLFSNSEPIAQIEGSAYMELASQGEAFADTIAAGLPDVTINPVTEISSEISAEETLDSLEPDQIPETIEPTYNDVVTAETTSEVELETVKDQVEPKEVLKTLEAEQTPTELAALIPLESEVPVPEQRLVVEPVEKTQTETQSKKTPPGKKANQKRPVAKKKLRPKKTTVG